MLLSRSSLRLFAAAGICLAATLTAAPAAHADWGDPVDFSLRLGSTAIAEGVGQASSGKTATLVVYSNGTATAQNTTVTISRPASVLTVDPVAGTGCTATTTAITCPLGAQPSGATALVPLVMRVRAGVHAGAAVRLNYSVTGSYQGKSYPDSENSTMDVVSSAPDLAARSAAATGVRPGSTIRMPVVFANEGDQPTTGLVLQFMIGGRYATYPTSIDGCVANNGQVGYQLVCSYPDAVLQPGHTYQFEVDSAAGLPLAIARTAPGPVKSLFGFNALSGAEATAAAVHPAGHATHHAGLVDVTGTATPRAADADPVDNTGSFWWTTAANPADLGVSAVHLYGQVGDVLPVTVAVRDNGPGDTPSRADVAIGEVTVTAPAGTVFSAVPSASESDCIQVVDGKPAYGDPLEPGHAQYLCGLGTPDHLAAGSTQAMHFQLTIQRATVGTDGSLVLDPMGTNDPNTRNNTAPLTVAIGSSPSASPSAPGGGHHPSASASTPVAGGNGGGSGSLPVTGTQIGLYAGAGAAVLLAGAVLVVLARRRRARG